MSVSAQYQERTKPNGSMFNPNAGRHVLIVEDDVSLAKFLCEELRAESFAVDLAHDAETALEDPRRRPALRSDDSRSKPAKYGRHDSAAARQAVQAADAYDRAVRTDPCRGQS